MLSILKDQGVQIENLKNSIYQKRNHEKAYRTFKSNFYKHFIKMSSKIFVNFLGNMDNWKRFETDIGVTEKQVLEKEK